MLQINNACDSKLCIEYIKSEHLEKNPSKAGLEFTQMGDVSGVMW